MGPQGEKENQIVAIVPNIARHWEKVSNPQKRTNFTVTHRLATADLDGNAVASVARRFPARAHSRSSNPVSGQLPNAPAIVEAV